MGAKIDIGAGIYSDCHQHATNQDVHFIHNLLTVNRRRLVFANHTLHVWRAPVRILEVL
jgi:hypothetical protein